MGTEERIVERIIAVEMARRAGNDVEYVETKLPNKAILRSNIDGEVITTKQSKIREKVIVPQKPKEERVGNGIKIAERPEKAAVDKMEYADRIITEIHIRVPIIYYAVMVFGLASAIFGAVTTYPVYHSVMLGGIGVFLVGFIGFLEVIYKRRIYKRRILKITG
jgi:hypothetical protein